MTALGDTAALALLSQILDPDRTGPFRLSDAMDDALGELSALFRKQFPALEMIAAGEPIDPDAAVFAEVDREYVRRVA